MNHTPLNFVTLATFNLRSRPMRPALSHVRYHQHFLQSQSRPARLHSRQSPGPRPVAVQARPVSGDSDGEVRDQVTPTPQKSSSVGVTIVSDCDARLRRTVTERIVAEADVGRIVVVTTAGITATDETDGLAASSDEPPLDSTPSPDATDDIPSADRPADDGEEPADPVNGFESLDSDDDAQTPSAVHNLEGWISCSNPEEMVEVVLKLCASKECDYVIAECAADDSIEPQELAHILHGRGGSTLRVDALVSVLDGDTLLQDLSAVPAPTEPVDDSDLSDAPSAAPRPVKDENTPQRAMMVVKLVENANVIVVRQSSTEESDQLSRVQSVVAVLNGTASIVSATDEAVPVNLLINTNTYDNKTLKLGATWKRVLLASRTAETGDAKPPALPKSLKEATFLYKARRPFHPQRLYNQIKAVATFTGVIRSTGRIWLATRMNAPLEWNQAGVSATLRNGKPFWASLSESEWSVTEEERKKIMSKWDAQHGDRETEMVFVGIDIDKTRLQGMLDGCLLLDDEMVFANMWENFEDPFLEWVPLSEDEEEIAEEEAIAEAAAFANPSTQDSHIEQDTKEADSPSSTDDAELELKDVSDDNEESAPSVSSRKKSAGGAEPLEGEIASDQIPDTVIDNISALNILDIGFDEGIESAPKPLPEDDGSYDEERAVIASWDGRVADGILTQIPKLGLPITILTGFLGSGKTTVLNHILTAKHGLKVAALVNEFGEVDIDNQLVEKINWDDDEFTELVNGCICCNMNDSFLTTVATLLGRKDRVDYVIVETTGIADPVPVINSLMASPFADEVRIDGVLTVVDADNFDTDTHMGSEAALSQIMAADTILLSKTDIASTEKVNETISYIQSVRPGARILRSQQGRVPVHMVLDVGIRVADSPAFLNPVKKETIKQDLEHDHDHNDEHDHDHSDGQKCSHDHEHDGDHKDDCTEDYAPQPRSQNHSHGNHLEADGFVTTSFKSDDPFNPELFMNKFLQRLPQGVYRAKGLLCFYGCSSRYVFQLSGRRYQFREDDWPEGTAPGNQLVIIGKDLDLEALRETLEGCLAESTV